MYLPKADWSPRFDSTFYTFTMDNKHLLGETDEATKAIPHALHGRNNFPAYYYELVVHRGRETTSIWRRYSHFQWLFHQIKASPPIESQASDTSITFPSSTCFYQKQNEEFAQARLLLLRDWLNDVLIKPGYASHPAVMVFLELALNG
jgi:hypothetical protein